jgi:acetone carboxylase gamma subunit
MDPGEQTGEELVFRAYLCPSCALVLDTEICRPGDEPFTDLVLHAPEGPS